MSRPRRVLLFVYWLSFGGMEQQAIHLARALTQAGDDVTIGYVEPYLDVDALRAEGIGAVDLRAKGPVRRLLALPRIARLAAQADVVHCTGWDPSAWGRIAAWLARRPVIVTEHSSPGRETQASLGGRPNAHLIGWHNRLLDRVTHATVAVAEPQVARLRAEGVTADKIVVIPNGAPLDELRHRSLEGASRADLGIPENARVVIQVGRFLESKRQAWTYRAVARLREELGDVHVLFPGVGSMREELERQARDDGASWAHFLGTRRDVPALLALSDLAVLPSAAEALPMVMIEAMALGVPQVATDAGDVGRVLRESGAGIVVDVDDEDGYLAACREVLADATVAARFRRAAPAAAERFAVEVMAARYDELFDAAIAASRRRRRP
jgi:glycosyltransferase involved in cell wall biosynthesis